MKEEPKQEVPSEMEFDHCPACGSFRRLAESVAAQEMAKGKLPPNQKSPLGLYSIAITNPGIGSLSCPAITAFVDACLDCGCLYITHAAVQDMPTTQLQQRGRNPGFAR